MSKKIKHEQVKSMINNLNEGLNFRLFNVMVDYIAQQERLDNELTNTMIIANSRLERLNGLELEFDKQEKLLVLYKEFFDKLNIQLRNTFDIDYMYPHEFIIGYDIKSEDKELVKLFKQIKELENDIT